jgi:hypothetical protein
MQATGTGELFGRWAGRAAALALLLGPALAAASSHREAPAIIEDPAADNTDLYAWLNEDRSRIYIIANWIPLQEPSSGPNFYRFSDDVLYAIHVTRGASSLDDAVVFEVEFSTPEVQRVDPADLAAPPGGGKEFFIQLTGALAQTYTLTKVDRDASGAERRTVLVQDGKVAPPRIGPRTQQVANQLGLAPFTSPTYDDAFAATFITSTTGDTNGRVFVGPRDDPFYVDIGAISDLANLRPAGQAQDNLAGFNVSTIALELPVEQLTADGQRPTQPGNDSLIGLWASSSRRAMTTRNADGTTASSGDWVQVSRLAIPLVNEALIGFQDKDRYNRTQPKDDVANFGAYFLNPVLVRDAEAVGIYQQLGVDPAPFRSNRTDILDAINLKDVPTAGAHSVPLQATGDVLRVDLATASGFPNGRPINPGTNQEQADVTDVILSLVLARGQAQIGDGVARNDRTFLSEFPFLALPFQAFDEGHGAVPSGGGTTARRPATAQGR